MHQEIKTKLKGKTILVVEDDQISAEYLKEVFEEKGVHLIFANSGEDAINLVINNPQIEVVLMDIRLPGINGYKATEEIKKIRKDLPVIAQTAYALDGDHSKALAAGCVAYISKPIGYNELLSLILKVLFP